MYVLADVEWVENDQGLISFTQIAMFRVDEKWKLVRCKSRRIRPKDSSFHQWDHMAFTGGTKDDFLSAPSYSQAFEDIQKWLWPGDTICWWSNESKEWIQKMVPTITNRQIVINERVANFTGQKLSSPYQLGRKLKLLPPGEKHNSRNDVEMMRMVLEAIHFPQPIPEIITPVPAPPKAQQFPFEYIAHIETNRIHKKGCTNLPTTGSTKCYNELTKPVGKGYVPCDCVKDDFRKARRIRNQSTIDRTEYSFIYSPDSQVFHRRDCKIALNAKQIMGTVQYHKCLATGRQPCKVCNPQYEDETYKHVLSGKKGTKRKQQSKGLSADEQRAIKRHRQAQEERMSYIQSGALKQEGKDDLYTLTQPRFAFWAATGYNTFHLRHCKKMVGLTHLKGFSLYADATSAGYRPCKCCKPTSKHDINVSLPIYSKKRYGDGVQALIDACEAHAYEYKQDGSRFTFETPVGIWRLDTTRTPYRIQHINTAMNPNNRITFHNQPRLFYSLKDVFDYVKRHDDHLLAASMGGTA